MSGRQSSPVRATGYDPAWPVFNAELSATPFVPLGQERQDR